MLQQIQAALPTIQGGLGLGCAELTAAPAYLASWADYLGFMHNHRELATFVNSQIDPANLPPAAPRSGRVTHVRGRRSPPAHPPVPRAAAR